MFFRKKSVEDMLNDIEKSLRLAMIKFEAGARIILDKSQYMRMYQRVTIPSALAGFPIPPLTVSHMYLGGALADIEKALKMLRKAYTKLRELYPELYALYSDSISRAEKALIEILDLAKVKEPLQDKLEKFKRNVFEVLAICSDIKTALAIRSSMT